MKKNSNTKNKNVLKIFQNKIVIPFLLVKNGKKSIVAKFKDGNIPTKNGQYINYKSI